MSVFLEDLNRTLLGLGASALSAHKITGIVRHAHTRPSRHYHTLAHLEHLHAQLLPLHAQLQDPRAVILAIAYHDLCYQVRSTSNERRSAKKATEQLNATGINGIVVLHCANHILATATHEPSRDPDTDLFTDADLSILGAPPGPYDRYAQQVRQEYAIYPDLLYRPGRRKVLQHFLDMERIFKTDHFHALYEQQARLNLARERAALGGA